MNYPGHPLLAPGATQPVIAEHRVILYARIGPGTHPCHHCGTPVTWTTNGVVPGALITDHLNRDPSDNRPENLVPSCWSCNMRNAARALRPEELVVQHGNATTRGEVRTCAMPGCPATFEVAPAKKRRCCSRRCGQRLRRLEEATISSGTS